MVVALCREEAGRVWQYEMDQGPDLKTGAAVEHEVKEE